MSADAQRAQQLFQEALDRPAEERAVFLDAACGDNRALRGEVDSLLSAYEAATKFMAPGGAHEAATSERDGTVIGRYKLLEKIGEGGFGVVWCARQTAPVRRKVALKIIKLGMDTRQVVARFEAERQALALMNHPNIAKVLDGGATGTGRPYFVMELVPGVAVTDFADQQGLTPHERIEMFIHVCRAVQHAHQKGVIHRDLKPSNVLVHSNEGKAQPKIIDFGIAKATGQELTQKTLYTEFRQMVGTPEYMAPEQAELSGLDVDTRADVYSLGVILYELLTGTKPFDLEDVVDRGYVEILRCIREVDPPKPSTRLSTLGDRMAAVAQRRRVEPRRLGRLLRGDLDWIVMRSLEKVRGRRYPTASALAEDLQRFLDGLPVEAGPPGTLYRVGKFVKRHRGLAAAASVAVFALLAAVVSTSSMLRRALDAEQQERAERRRAEFSEKQERTAREAAERSAEEARLAASRAEAVLRFTQDMLGSANPHAKKGKDYTVRELLDEFDRRLRDEPQEHPEVEAALRATVGDAYRSLGVYDRAEPHLRAALELRRDALGTKHPQYGESLWHWAWFLHDRGSYAEALRSMNESLDVVRATDPESHEVAQRLFAVADIERHMHRFDVAETHARESLAMLEQLEGDYDIPIALNLNVLFLVARDTARYDEAERYGRRALWLFRRGSPDGPSVAMSLNNLATLLQDRGRYAESERLHRECLELKERLLGVEHPDYATSLNRLAAVVRLQGRDDEAERLLDRSLSLLQRTVGEEHLEVADVRSELGTLYRHRRRYAEAEEQFRKALAIRRAKLRDPHQLIAVTSSQLALVLSDLGHHDEAETLLRDADGQFREIYGDRHTAIAMSSRNMAKIAYRLGRCDEAEAAYRKSLELYRHFLGDDHPAVLSVLEGLGRVLHKVGRPAEAVEVWQEAMAMRRQLGMTDGAGMSTAEHWLGLGLLATGDVDQAVMVLRDCLERRIRDEPDSVSRWNTAGLLGEALMRHGDYAEAAPLLGDAWEHGDPGDQERRLVLARALVSLYENWSAADPSADKSEQAERWRAELARLSSGG